MTRARILKAVVVVSFCAMAMAPSGSAQDSGQPPAANSVQHSTEQVLPEVTNAWDAVFWTYTLGFDFSRGDYGLDRDSTLYFVPVGVIVDYARFRFRLVLPFLVSDGPTRVSLTGDLQSLESETNSGLGEITASASYLFDPFAKGLPYVELGAQITAPTRTNRALGTGLWSFAPRIDVFQRWGRVTPFASVARRFYTSGSIKDRFSTSLGMSLELSETMAAGVSYDWLEERNGRTPDGHEIVPFLSVKLAQKWKVAPYAVFGLTDGSPDYGLGIGLSFAP